MKTNIQNFALITILVCSYSPINAQNDLYLMATITGEEIGDCVGGVEWVGDVNGDGFDDVLINTIRGSWSYYSLYHGGAPFDTVADVKLARGRASGAGDVNADGYNDILVARIKSLQEDPYDGRLYVYLGGPDSLTLSDFEFADDYRFCPTGVGKVGGIGDVNKDGFDDFIYSSMYNWCDGMARVYLFLGGDTLDSRPKLTFMTNKLGDDFGRSGSSGDVSGDGYDDLIIGAPIGPGGMEYDTGKVMIYYGGTEMDNIADVILSGEALGEDFGYNLKVLGDVNGDSFDDFLIGESGLVRQVFFYLGGDNILTEAKNCKFRGEGNFGYTFSELGDINNDNMTDFMIYAGNSSILGDQYKIAIKIYFGSANIDSIADIVYVDQIGNCSQLAGPGDVNGDGYRDIILGDVNYVERGRVRIFSIHPIAHVDRSNEDSNPKLFKLAQNYPNPFNSKTIIHYDLQFSCQVNMDVFNSKGEKIKALISASQIPGAYDIIWDAAGLPSGIYLCRIETETESETIKLLLIK